MLTGYSRIPEDVASLDLDNNFVLEHREKKIGFLCIQNFILSMFTLLTPERVDGILKELRSFMAKIDRPVTTKEGWNAIFSD